MGTIHQWHQYVLQPDISHYVVLSKLRCIVTLISLVLFMTDIPRTGLGIRNLYDFYPVPLMPSTAVRFGPFNYPVLHISQRNQSSESSSEFIGFKGKQPTATARVWSYQYDTTSVGLRGAVELLNMTEFPPSLLYKPQAGELSNATSLLELSTVFTMLDAFISASREYLRPEEDRPMMLRYATKHNWVDRMYHYVVSFVSKNSAWRLHSLHTPRISLDPLSISICSNTKRSSPRPRFCNHPGIWKCSNPLDASLPPVRLWDHMDLRLQSLQRQYPNLKLEVALVSSQRLSSTSGAMRSTFYNYEALEIVVLTRGRRCTAGSCSTVFVDDYRYERDIVQTNLVDWYGIISTLRGAAQGYVWIRLILLTYGAYVASGQKDDWELGWSSRWVATATLVLKIPFQVVVYSSFFPVCAYVGALLLDSSFMDIFLDSYWASVGGAVNFQLVPFLETTAVQMRSVWLLALLAFMLVFVVRRTRDHWHDGVPGIRGLLISFTSTLTIFGPYKIATLRDTNITSVFRIADEGSTMDIIRSNPSGYVNASSYIFDDSATMLLFCIGAVTVLAVGIKGFGSLTPQDNWIHRECEGVVLGFTPINPSGTRRLWPMSVLSIRFHAVTRPSNVQGPRSSNLTPLIGIIASSKSQVASAPTIDLTPTRQGPSRHIRSISLVNTGTLRRSPLRSVRWSSTEFRSIVQLMNVAMMTDPWNLIWLRVLGIQVYLYQIHRSQSQSNRRPSSFAVILPFGEDEVDGEYELLDSANSKDVPMSLLLQCG